MTGATTAVAAEKWSLVHTYSEDPLGLATCTHVGVVDVFEHHPGLIVFSHLGHRGGQLRQRQTLAPLHNVCTHRRPRRRLSQTSKKFLSQRLVIILLLELTSMPATALLFLISVSALLANKQTF